MECDEALGWELSELTSILCEDIDENDGHEKELDDFQLEKVKDEVLGFDRLLELDDEDPELK